MRWFRRQYTPPVLDLRGAKPARTQSRRVLPRRRLIVGGLAIAATTLLAVIGMWLLQHPAATGKTGMQAAVARVGQLMLLPEGETPTYGTVTDKTKLARQTFFAHAENGDEVLIYEKAHLSILYRPSINKIVNVGPLVVGKQSSPYITSHIAILNGTDSSDKLTKMTQAVTTAFPNATITTKGPASRAYPTTIAADLTGHNQPLTEQVADILGIQGGKLPLGEPAPDADLLIIIGQDYK